VPLAEQLVSRLATTPFGERSSGLTNSGKR
jgi:hypothetical protein